MNESKIRYKFGLYGRCPVCKEIYQEICEGCGSTEAFTDSSKPGIVLCNECGLEHSIKCSKQGCGNQIKVLRTPKNGDEKGRIDEFIYRKKNKDMDKRTFTIKESPQTTTIKEVKIPLEDLKKKNKTEIISLDSDIDMDIQIDTQQRVLEKGVEPKIVQKSAEPAVIAKENAEVKFETSKIEDGIEEPIISLKDESQKQAEKAKVSTEPTREEKQELDKIKNFWKTKEISEKEEKKEEERRIVNQFYDEQDDDALDKKINFENTFNETAYFDCRVCGKEEQKIVCDKCGQYNQFSLNYDSLSCKCTNDIKVITCDCGAKHGHSDFFLVSDGIKWQYSKSKSFYNYRKGRMLVFSTCPTCAVFSVEKCKVCGSKVNFGFPNKNNEVYCKNCGTVNQFLCENRNCNDSVKALKNPNSVEQQLEWLNEVMNFKSKVSSDRIKYTEPGTTAKKVKADIPVSSGEISLGSDSTPDFTNSFIEDFDSRTKEIITSSFISEVENEVNQRKKLQDELRNYNKTQSSGDKQGAKPTFGTPAGAKPSVPSMIQAASKEDDGSSGSVIAFDDSAKKSSFYIIIGVIVLVVLAAGSWGIFALMKDDGETAAVKTEVAAPVVQPTAEAVKDSVKSEESKEVKPK